MRWRADGELEFLGRADDQIKINGIRVEPGEIEATLLALPEIAAAAVKLCEDAAGVRRLTAYLVPSRGAVRATETVRAALERQLPRNMVPTYFVWLDAMPMTPNGKLDRKALPAPPREEARSAPDHPPETKLEREIAAIWEDLLQVSSIGVRSGLLRPRRRFLALVSLFATIEARFGRHLTVDVLAGGLTIAGLAQTLAHDGPLDAEDWIQSSHFSRLAIFRRSFVSTESAATCCTCTASPCIWERIVPFWVCAGLPKLTTPTLSATWPRVTWLLCWLVSPPGHSILEDTRLVR